MPSDYVKKLEMNEVDDNSQNFLKQVINMTTTPSSTSDILSDFLNEELNTNQQTSNPQNTNMSIDAANRMSHLPSDLQFLRMDSFPPVSSIPSTVSHNQYQQVTAPEQIITSLPRYTTSNEAQPTQFVSSSHLTQVVNTQFYSQTGSHMASTQNQFTNPCITSQPNQVQYILTGVTSPKINTFEDMKNSQFQQNSPQMINEVSSSVNSPETSVQFDASSPEALESPHLNMPVTHSSPSTELINEPPAMKSCLLQNILTKDSSSQKISLGTSNAEFTTSSNQYNTAPAQVQQVNIAPNNFHQNLPAGILTSVQNTALPPGSILVLTPSQFQNTGNQFSNQQFSSTFNGLNQQPFSVSIASPQNLPVNNQNNVHAQIQLNQLPVGQINQNQQARFHGDHSSPQSPNVGSAGHKIESASPQVNEQQNAFTFANPSQPQVNDSELRFLLEKLAEPKQAALNNNLAEHLPQIRGFLQNLCRQSSDQGNQASDTLRMPNRPAEQPLINNFATNQGGGLESSNQGMNVGVEVPKTPEVGQVLHPSTFVPNTITLPPALQTNDENLKTVLLKALEKHLEEQVYKQVKEEQMTSGNNIMETNQVQLDSKKMNIHDQFSPIDENKTVDVNLTPTIVGQKRQLSPNRLVYPNFPVLNSKSQPMDTQICFDTEANDGIMTSKSNSGFPVNIVGNYRNVEQFSEDMTQFMEKTDTMDTGLCTGSHPKLMISTSQDDSVDKSGNGSMLRKILTAEVDTCNSSPSPSPISSPEIQLESPSSLSSPNSALFDGNTQLSLLQKSEELNLNADNVDESPSDLWNMFSDDDNLSMVPPKSHKSKRNHDTHSTTFDKNISESLFDAGGAVTSSSFKFTQFGQELVTFGLPMSQNETEATSSALLSPTTKKPPQPVAGGESLKSVVPPVPKTIHNRKMKEATLSGPYPSKVGDLELRIITQPEEQHRARYLTEGSRGAVKDSTQQGYPVVQLFGYNEPTTLQIFIACESGRIKPHGFYQACRVCGKNSTQCTEKTYEGTVVIETEILPSSDMTVSIDCVGILKLRNADVEKRIGVVKAKAKKKNNTRARMVFRVTVKKPDGNFQVLQAASSPILCTQPIGQPEIGRVSLSGGSISGGESLFIIGKNFMKGTKVIFQELMQEDGAVLWEKEAEIDTEFFQQQHLICTVPDYHGTNITKPAVVQIVIKCNNKISDGQKYLYQPVLATIKKEVPMETDEDQMKAPSFVSPVALELNRLIQQTQNGKESTSLFQLPPGAVSALTTQPLGSVSMAGQQSLQSIAGHDKMIMTSSRPNTSSHQQTPVTSNPQLIMVSNGVNLNQPNVVSLGASSPNQSQPMIVILPASGNNITNNQTSQASANAQVESLLKSLLGNATSNN